MSRKKSKTPTKKSTQPVYRMPKSWLAKNGYSPNSKIYSTTKNPKKGNTFGPDIARALKTGDIKPGTIKSKEAQEKLKKATAKIKSKTKREKNKKDIKEAVTKALSTKAFDKRLETLIKDYGGVYEIIAKDKYSKIDGSKFEVLVKQGTITSNFAGDNVEFISWIQGIQNDIQSLVGYDKSNLDISLEGHFQTDLGDQSKASTSWIKFSDYDSDSSELADELLLGNKNGSRKYIEHAIVKIRNRIHA